MKHVADDEITDTYLAPQRVCLANLWWGVAQAQAIPGVSKRAHPHTM